MTSGEPMNYELLFTICNFYVLPGWLLLAFAPRWRPSATLIAPVLIPATLAAMYLVLLLTNWGTTEGSFTSLTGVASLFDDPALLLAGWIHYLAFDLFIGSWEVRDAGRSGIAHALVLPCLVLTCLVGPIGLLLYLGLRTLKAGPALSTAR